jgi:hypothetical protein
LAVESAVESASRMVETPEEASVGSFDVLDVAASGPDLVVTWPTGRTLRGRIPDRCPAYRTCGTENQWVTVGLDLAVNGRIHE